MDPELLKRIDALAEKVGQTGERLFAALVQREVVSGWTWLIVGCVAMSAFLAFGVALFRWGNEDVKKHPGNADAGGGYYLVAIASWIIASIFLLSVIPVNAIRLATPEAAALRTLLGK